VAGQVVPGLWKAAALSLAGSKSAENDEPATASSPPDVALDWGEGDTFSSSRVVVRWQDGGITHVDLPKAGGHLG
jgi:hypothetical protein